MKFRRFVGSTAREAMRQLKEELGDEALILSNRPCAQGVEIIATVDAGIEPFRARSSAPIASSPASRTPAPTVSVAEGRTERRATHPLPAQRPVMSTLSFQDYVRDRLAQNPLPSASESQGGMPLASTAALLQATHQTTAPAQVPVPPPARSEPAPVAAQTPTEVPRWLRPQGESSIEFPANVASPVDEPAVWRARPRAMPDPALLDELREVKAMLRQQVRSVRWMGGDTESAARIERSRQLLDAGLSPGLIRYLMEHMPDDLEPSISQQWMEQALERNCRKSEVITDLLEKGGICALVGPTGVGKTTTIAKLAARAVIRHGAPQVALITLDNFRVGAYEQLAVYGRLLGVSVQQARDGEALARLLQHQKHKKAVLIDTVGVAQKDDRLKDLLQALEQPGLRRVFVTSAAAQGDTIDRALAAFQVKRGDPVILTKLDEVERLGMAVDCIVRHGLGLAGLTDGQRVPQDWRAADPCLLAHQVLRPHPADDPWQMDQTAAYDRLSKAQSLDDGAYV